MRPQHPEATVAEVWIGNMFAADFRSVGWRTKRLGKTAYLFNGDPIPKTQGFRPVFVARSEIEAAGIEITDSGPIDHRW
jgi:hypothetical protein